MKRLIDLERWERKDHYNFFKDFSDPYFGICTDVDCTASYEEAKTHNIPFFILYLHKSLKAAHLVEEFRYRISEEGIVCYDTLRASPTIDRENGTFGFGYIEYHEDFATFEAAAGEEIERVRNATGLVPATHDENVIHYSTLPWIRFTGLSYPRHSGLASSIPQITFGKFYRRHASMYMPVSIHVHHGLMDGFHVGRYLDLFQELLNKEG